MKKSMLFATVFAVNLLAAAGAAQTVLFEEDFNAGIPAGWSNIQLGYTGDIWEPGFGLVNGTGDVFHEGFCDFGVFLRNNILLSPVIDLTNVNNATFKASQHHSFASSINYNAIEVTTDGGRTYSVLHEVTNPGDGVSTITANMDAFVGQPVQIAIHYIGVITNNWSVDDIQVSTPWSDLGGALGGKLPRDPQLTGIGSLFVNSPIRLELAGAPPNGLAHLIVGFRPIDSPFFGGILIPSPDVVLTFVTNDAGSLTIHDNWPTGIPSDFSAYFQFWMPSEAGPFGFIASNAVSGTTP